RSRRTRPEIFGRLTLHLNFDCAGPPRARKSKLYRRSRFAEPAVRVTWSSSLAATISLAVLAVTSLPMIVSAEPTDVRPTDAQYFIDFRSRAGYMFGHTYIVYGRLNTPEQPVD